MRPRFTPPTWSDLIAGISVALVLIPQSLAYAELAGLPPVHGLYAAAAAPLAAAAIGSSPYLQTGPVALTSLLSFGALSPLVAQGTDSFIAYAALLALLVGVVRLALGALRWGALAYFMSLPVVSGFTVAASLLIIASQVPGLVSMDSTSKNPAVAAGEALAKPGNWSLIALLIGLGTIALILVGRRLQPLFPWALAATVTALLASGFGLVNVAEVGTIPSGLPPVSLDLPWHAVPELILPAVLIALVGFAEPASIARRYAAADRVPWDPDREFIGQGLANLAAGVAGGYACGGSFSRSALNRLAGARTRWSGAFTGAAVIAALPFAGVLSALPTAVLSGIVITAVISLVDLGPFREYWRYSRAQFFVAVPTFAATLATAPRVERGLLIGVGLALAVHLWRETQLHLETNHEGTTLHIRPEGVLYYASVPTFETRLSALLDEHPGVQTVVIDLHRVGRLDLSGLLAFRGFAGYAHAAGATVEIRGIPAHARERASRVFGEDCPNLTVRPDPDPGRE